MGPVNATSALATDHLRLLVEAQTEYAMFLLDPDGCVATWNPGARRIKGYEPDEIIGRHFSAFYTEPDIARGHPQHELRVATETGRFEEEGWRLRKDGSRFWANVVITALRDEQGTLVGFGKVTRDLTSRRLAEEQLRRQTAELEAANQRLRQFQLLVASVRDYAIFMLDPGGHILTWNAGAEALKGYTEPEIVGRHFSTFYTDADIARDHPAHELEIAGREGRFEEEGWRVRKDGTTFWANVVITALRNEHGVLVGFAKVTRDLTERRAAAEELRATADELARSNAELEHFASIAAHDLVEPLHTMHGMADLLERRYADRLDADARSFLGVIGDEAVRLRALVDGLLAYARAGKREVNQRPVPLGDVVEEVVEGLRARIKDSDATVRFDRDALPSVCADRPLLGSIVQNLVGNALKFGGQHPRVEITAQREDGAWRISVTDDGIGIPSAEQERIFDLFHRLHPRDAYAGTGLGLALTQRLVARHGGRIGVRSAPDEGSCFWFTLPAADDA
jgi:PAS domain S-box-containing protein